MIQDNSTTRAPTALTIAGSDSGAGAGIQADLKTFAALGVYGTSALTAITAQNTLGVRAVEELSPTIVAAQIDAVIEDIDADAVKTGMLASAAITETVAERLGHHGITQVVVDPVMVAKSGDRLLREDAVQALRQTLLPLALVVTPNLPEAEILAGMAIRGRAELEEAARRIAATGARYVLVKGGHAPGDPVDVLFDGRAFKEFAGPRVQTRNTHGTGCTLSAAIAAYLARGAPVEQAVRRAKDYLTAALRTAYPIGHGHGPLNHFHALQRQQDHAEHDARGAAQAQP
jgi:hydroxymethylpyrimidine/phosphomethylpyrimidine kinase